MTILSPPTDTTNGGDGKVFRGARVGVRRMTCRSGDAGYALEGVRLESPFSYLVVLGASGPAQLKRDRIDIDLTGDGKPESVRVCASQEGEHFTIWSGPTLRGKRLAHQYVSLGYDVEPNCRPAEYEDLPPK